MENQFLEQIDKVRESNAPANLQIKAIGIIADKYDLWEGSMAGQLIDKDKLPKNPRLIS
jgi:hypothetical protein